MNGVGQLAFVGTVEKKSADDGGIGFQTSVNHAVAPLHLINIRNALADHIGRSQAVDVRLCFIEKQNPAINIGDDDALVKAIKYRKEIKCAKDGKGWCGGWVGHDTPPIGSLS